MRLVVDTGIHAKGWTRDQVVEFFRKSGTIDEPMIQTETDRYIAWPGQALSYKLGQLKFRELRERARKELGPKFDIKTFHDEMLSGGVLPLDLLQARTESWIKAQESRAQIAEVSHGKATQNELVDKLSPTNTVTVNLPRSHTSLWKNSFSWRVRTSACT